MFTQVEFIIAYILAGSNKLAILLYMKNYQYNQTIDNEYTIKRTEAIQKQLTEKDQFTWQQHHDYYVKKYNEVFRVKKGLNKIEKAQYEIAILREKQGFVKPLI